MIAAYASTATAASTADENEATIHVARSIASIYSP
jgi:hypothetical protein